MKKKIFFSAITLLAIIALGAFIYIKTNPPYVAIPKPLSQKMQIPLYLPGWLPGDYQVDKASISIQDKGVFTYSATNSQRDRLFFTQQPRSKNFDFDRFYKTQVINPVKLDKVPYATVYAQALYNKATIISIVTDKSWIMISTTALIDPVMAQKISQEMKISY